jgi:hypothetical protein
MNIFISLGVIVSTFLLSTLTAFLICYVNNYSFMNPAFSKEIITLLHLFSFKTAIINGTKIM